MRNAIIIGNQRERHVVAISLAVVSPSARVLSRYSQNSVDATIVYSDKNGTREVFTDHGGRITFEAPTNRLDIQAACVLAMHYMRDETKAISLEGDPKFVELGTAGFRKQGILVINREIDTLFTRTIGAIAGPPDALAGGPVSLDQISQISPELVSSTSGLGKIEIRNTLHISGSALTSSVFTAERSPKLVVYRKVDSDSRMESSLPCIADTGKTLILLDDGTFDRRGSHDPGAIWLMLVLATGKKWSRITNVPQSDGKDKVAEAFIHHLLPEAVRQGIGFVDSAYSGSYHELKSNLDAFRRKIATHHALGNGTTVASSIPSEWATQGALWVHRQQFPEDLSRQNLDPLDRVLIALEGISDQSPLASKPLRKSTPVKFISVVTLNAATVPTAQPAAAPRPAFEGFPGKELLEGWDYVHGRNDDRVRGIKHFLDSMADDPIDLTRTSAPILSARIHRWTNNLSKEMQDKGTARDTLLDRTQAVTSLLTYGRVNGWISGDIVDVAIASLKHGEDALKRTEPKIPEEFLHRVEYPLLKAWCGENRDRPHLLGPVFQFITGIESESNITEDEFNDTKKIINEWYRGNLEKNSLGTVSRHLCGVQSFFEYGLDHGFLSLEIVSAARSALDELREKSKHRQQNDEIPSSMRDRKDDPLISAWRQVRQSTKLRRAVERFLEGAPEILGTSDPTLLCKHIEDWTTRLEEKILDRVWSFRTALDHIRAVRSLFTYAQTHEFVDSRTVIALKSVLEAQEGRLTLRYSKPHTASLRKEDRTLVEEWCRENFNSSRIAPVLDFVKGAPAAFVTLGSADVACWSEEHLKRVDSHTMSPFTFQGYLDGVRSLFEYGRRRGALLDTVVDEVRLTLGAIQERLSQRKMEVLISSIVDHPNRDLVTAWCQMHPQIQQEYLNGISRLFKANPVDFMKLDEKDLGKRIERFVEQLNNEVRVKKIAPISARDFSRGGVSFFSYCRAHEPTQVGITDYVMSTLKSASVSFRREDMLLRQRSSTRSSKKQSSIR